MGRGRGLVCESKVSERGSRAIGRDKRRRESDRRKRVTKKTSLTRTPSAVVYSTAHWMCANSRTSSVVGVRVPGGWVG